MGDLKADLISFEEEIATEFNAGTIPYPIHLEDGNEDQLIEIFKEIRQYDWVFGSWRLHLKCLLKGVPRETLKDAIRRGESMALRFPKERVYGSAIVGGTLPIALGAALAIKRRDGNEKVWCFLGDMTYRSGIAYECISYANSFELPIIWVVEDNGVSVCTNTREVWGLDDDHSQSESTAEVFSRGSIRHYQYKSKWPHACAGVRVQC